MKIAVTGLPQSGKSTIFSALVGSLSTGTDTDRKKQDLVTIKVPDSRLDALSEIFKPKKTIYADIVCLDTGNIAETGGDRKPDSSHFQAIRTADVLCFVLRDFLEEDSPLNDYKSIMEEAGVIDLIVVENRLEKIEKQYQSTKKRELGNEIDVLHRCRETLEGREPLASLELDEARNVIVRGFQFLTRKPAIWVINIAEKNIANSEQITQKFKDEASSAGEVIPICGQAEMEIAELDPEERPAFMEELGIRETGLSKLIRASYDSTGLISFLTVVGKEVRAWPIPKNTRAQAAAGAIHSDIERGFIRAETIAFETFMETKSMTQAKTKGQLRLEGKDYIVQDGDIITFRFNVSNK